MAVGGSGGGDNPPWSNVFSDTLKAGYGSGSKGNSDDKKKDLSDSKLKQCDEVLKTHMKLPAGGVSAIFSRNREEGMVKFASWDFRGQNRDEAKRICQLANEQKELRALGFGDDKI